MAHEGLTGRRRGAALRTLLFTALAVAVAVPGAASAQEAPVRLELGSDDEAEVLASAPYAALPAAAAAEAALAAQANNPVGNSSFVNLQNQFIGNLSTIDQPANVLNLRVAQPFTLFDTQWIGRATVPLNTVPTSFDGDHVTGLGDTNVFAVYLPETGVPGLSFGIGPNAILPTATDDRLGSDKLSLGVASVLFSVQSPVWQWGYLATWQASVAGPDGADDVNLLAVQPLLLRQLGGGWYLRSTAVSTFDFANDRYMVPVGLGIGKVVPTETVVLNLFVEPQITVAHEGPGQMEWGIFGGINFQFPH